MSHVRRIPWNKSLAGGFNNSRALSGDLAKEGHSDGAKPVAKPVDTKPLEACLLNLPIRILAGFLLFLWVREGYGRTPRSNGEAVAQQRESDALHQLDASLKALTARVSPAVVEVLVSGYGTADAGNSGNSSVVTRQQSVGSGVIVDPSGYILTNEHVVARAERIEVMLAPSRFPLLSSRWFMKTFGKKARWIIEPSA